MANTDLLILLNNNNSFNGINIVNNMSSNKTSLGDNASTFTTKLKERLSSNTRDNTKVSKVNDIPVEEFSYIIEIPSEDTLLDDSNKQIIDSLEMFLQNNLEEDKEKSILTELAAILNSYTQSDTQNFTYTNKDEVSAKISEILLSGYNYPFSTEDMGINNISTDNSKFTNPDSESKSDIFNLFSDKLISLFSEDDSSVKVSDMMTQLKEILTQETADTNEKEDIDQVISNLLIKDIDTSPTQDIHVTEEFDIHPIAKQVLSSISNQLSHVDFTEKNIQIRLKLFPVKLGEISIELENANNILGIKIVSENLQVQNILESSIENLHKELEKHTNQSINIDISNSDGEQQNKNNFSSDNNNSIVQNLSVETIEADFNKNHTNISIINAFLDVTL